MRHIFLEELALVAGLLGRLCIVEQGHLLLPLFALFLAEQVTGLVISLHQPGKGVVAALELIAGHKGPFGKNDGLLGILLVFVHAHQAQGVAADDVAGQNKPHRAAAVLADLLFADGFVLLVPHPIKPLPAGLAVVLQNIHTVKAADGQNGVFFVVHRELLVFLFYNSQLPGQDLGEKIPIAAGGLQKAAVDALCLGFHEVAHRLYLPLGGKHLAVVRHPLFGFHLLCHAFDPPGNIIPIML